MKRPDRDPPPDVKHPGREARPIVTAPRRDRLPGVPPPCRLRPVQALTLATTNTRRNGSTVPYGAGG
jgi:hypothetical protein